MYKRFSLVIFLLASCYLLTSAQTEQPDDIAILRLLYRTQPLTTTESPKDVNALNCYQVGEATDHIAAVDRRVVGKFTQKESPEILTMVSIAVGSGAPLPVPTGFHALLLRVDKEGVPELITRPQTLQRKSAPFTSRRWRPILSTDIDFDEQDELVMADMDQRTGIESYSIYRWNGKDFMAITDNPALALLAFYAHLDAIAHAGEDAEQQINMALAQLSPKLKGQNSADSLRQRLQTAKGVEIEGLKILIKGAANALVRVQYNLVTAEGKSLEKAQADYQIKRIDGRWLLDTERLKVLTTEVPKQP